MSGQKVLVTGGAGYIGAHACKALARAGYVPVVFDNLSTGWEEAVRFGPLIKADLLDQTAVRAAFSKHQPVAVMHFAALSLVGDSMKDPGRYWRVNVTGALNLIEAAVESGCKKIVFSSTCATYGEHDGIELTEDTPQHPINAYGKSKRAIEDILHDFGASHGLEHVIFRYFNVAGADPEGELGEQHAQETHLVPLLIEAALGKRAALTIHGTDYATKDGTCIRDYVHVSDLVAAHVKGLDWLLAGRGSRAFNLGSGHGFSVREVIDAARRISNDTIPFTEGPRRAGDANSLVSGSKRAQEELGWVAERSNLSDMIADAWVWHRGMGFSR